MLPIKNKITALPFVEIKSACLLAGSFLCAVNSHAELAQSQLPLLETVVVTAQRQEQELASLAASVSVVDAKTNGLVGHIHPSQLMASVPGAWIVKGNGQEHLTAIRSPVFTGPGSCGEYVVAEDGLPTRPVGLCNVNQLFEVHTEQAQRIEVWRGPGAVVFGSNAVHGVINSISPQVADNNNISLEYGANDYARIALGLSDNEKSQRLAVQVSSDGGYKDSSGFEQQKITYKKISQGQGWQFKTVLSGSHLNQETAGFVEGERVYRESDRQKENPFPEAYRDAQSLRWFTTASHQLSEEVALIVTPFARYSDMEFMQHYLPGQAIERNHQTSTGFQSKINWALASGSDINIGLDTEYADMHVDEYQPDATDSVIDFLVATIPQGYHYDFDVSSQLIAVFSQANIAVNERTEMQLGLRYEAVEFDYQNRMLDGSSKDDGRSCAFGACRFSRPEDRRDSFNEWHSQLGVTRHINENLMTYFRYAQAYRIPQINELYRLEAEQSQASLDVETVDSVEFGFRGQLGGLAIDAVSYWMEKDKVIFRDSNRQVVSNGQTEHLGVETQIKWQWSKALSMSFNGAWSKHYYRQAKELVSNNIEDNHIDTSPRFIGQLALLWQHDNLQVQVEWVKTSSYYLDPENKHRYSGHVLMNARGTWAIDDSWQVQLNVLNLLDEHYADRADYAFGEYRYFIGEPRTGYLEINYSF